ncbi:MAG: TRAP transporter large permease [Spirochaetaceae bacterium]|jgi:C4-dicarboxylate transporter DctM subunit|nr:TRAP transporter large permease [Spirochaetaceae bacterium]
MISFFLILFIIGILIGIPVVFVLSGTAVIIMLWQGIFNPITVGHNMYSGLDSFPYLAIPFFMLAGSLMEEAKITKRLMDFAYVIVGRLSGGLAHVAIIMAMMFAAMSGSAVATAAAVAAMLLPAMEARGYKKSFSAALVASGGAIGPIIPPSIPMIVFATIAGVSVERMFLAGLMPGVLFGVFIMIYAFFVAKKEKIPREESKFSLKIFFIAFKEALLPLLMPAIILGGIFGGIFTATEAAVVSVVYAFILGVFVLRTLTIPSIKKALLNAAKSTSIISLILGSSTVMSWVLTSQRIPQQIAAAFLSVSTNPTIVLLLVMLLILIMGCFMDALAIIMLLSPIVLVVTNQLGIDPVFFGVLLTINVCIGALTPPVGTCLFVAAKIGNVSLTETSKQIIPIVLVVLFLLFLCILFPNIVVGLPNLVLKPR